MEKPEKSAEDLPSSTTLSSKSTVDETLIRNKDLRYGCNGTRPRCLQPMNNIVGFVVFLSMASAIQNMAQGLLGVVLSTVEKQFQLSSTQSSWIPSVYEIGPIPVLLLLGFMGPRVNRPRSIAVGLLLVMLGCVICIIPQFTTPPYRPSDRLRVDSMCQANKTTVCDVQVEEDYSYYLPVFIVAWLLVGMGSTPIYSVGINYVDDCATKEKFATYAGILYSMNMIGSAVGFLFGAWTLTLFVDFYIFSRNDIGIESDDPRWIGAWWLAFTLIAGLCLMNAIPLTGFPKDLPGAEEIRASKVTEAHNDKIGGKQESHNALSRSGLRTLIVGVLTNPTYVLLTVYATCENFIIGGFTAFGPKYFQFGFSMSPSFAGMIYGASMLPAGASGTIVGGLIIRKLRLSCRQILRLVACCQAIGVASCLLFLLVCPSVDFAGVNVQYNNNNNNNNNNNTIRETSADYNLTDACNSNCSCQEVLYEPICSHDKVQYYSPCHAGCTTAVKVGSTTEYYNCSCLTLPLHNPYSAQATSGVCSSGICTEAIIFIVGFFFAVFFIFACITMNLAATLRSVTSSQTSFALSFQLLFLKVVGMIPGPIIMGVAFDDVCVMWKSDCGSQGSCMFYDNKRLSRNFLIIIMTVKSVAFIATFLANVLYRPPAVVLEDIVAHVVANVGDGLQESENAKATILQPEMANIDANTDAGFSNNNDNYSVIFRGNGGHQKVAFTEDSVRCGNILEENHL